jgi:hypothetical protein
VAYSCFHFVDVKKSGISLGNIIQPDVTKHWLRLRISKADFYRPWLSFHVAFVCYKRKRTHARTHAHTHRKRTPLIAKRATLWLFHSESGFPIGRSVKHAMTARMLRSACVIRWNHLIGCSLPVRPCTLFTVKNSKWHLGEATSTWAVNRTNNDNGYLRIYLVLCRCNLAFFYFCNCAVSEADPIGEWWRL